MLSCLPEESIKNTKNPSLDENEEVINLAKKSGLNKKEFLARTFKPLNDKISSSRGELIAVHTRTYEETSFISLDSDYPVHLSLEERTQVGLITEKTAIDNEFLYPSRLVNNVNVIYPQNGFSSQPETSFFLPSFNLALPLLYFRDCPPAISKGVEIFGVPEKRSRLEIYIGDRETVPFLQKILRGYDYMSIRRLSGRDLPINKETHDKIRKEQLEIYERASNAILLISNIAQKNKSRLAAIKSQGGEAAFNHGTYIKLACEDTERMIFIESTEGVQRSLSLALNQAKARNYQEDGMTFEVQEDSGVIKIVDIKEYFSHKLKEYSHLLR